MCMCEYTSIYIPLIIFTSVICFTLTSNNFILVGKFSYMLILWNLLRNVFDEESYSQPTKIVHKILLEAVLHLSVLLLTSFESTIFSLNCWERHYNFSLWRGFVIFCLIHNVLFHVVRNCIIKLIQV